MSVSSTPQEIVQKASGPRPSPLACGECRKRHLKCDAKPVCTRCAINGLECSYTPSKRGGVCRAKRKASHHVDPKRQCPALASDPMTVKTSISPVQPAVDHEATLDFPPPVPRNGSVTSVSSSTTPTQPLPGQPDIDEDHLTNLFYTHFYLAHPFLVPRNAYHRQNYPGYLRLVICFVGSQYAATPQARELLRPLVATAMATCKAHSPHRVQALILYAIVLCAQNQSKEATMSIAQAAELAVSMGLNKPSFAASVSSGHPYQEESFRRTWWEVFVVDGYMAALRRTPTFFANTVAEHPFLPCEDAVFAQGVVNLHPLTLGQFEDRVFFGDIEAFSSYCYRIQAIRIIARVLAIAGANEADPDEVQAVDNAIASSKHLVPKSKADIIDQYGRVDHLLFQAHVFIQWATILLHFPRSDLPLTMPTSTVADFAGCAGEQDMPQRVTATSAQHTVKAVAASKELSNLAALPWCVTVYSPFFTCGLILGCIVQLSACSSHARSCLQQHRDRVTLMIGALKTLGETWAVARNAVGHLMKVAKGIFCCSGEATPVNACDDVGDGMLDMPELTWFDLFSLDDMTVDVSGFGTDAIS